MASETGTRLARDQDLRVKQPPPTAHDAIVAAPTGAFLTLRKINPSGVLQSRRLSSGAITLYWRYTFKSKTERIPIGLYDATRPPKSLEPAAGKYSLAAAERRAAELASIHAANKHEGGLRGAVQAEQRAREAAEAAAEEAAKHTLEQLLRAYCGRLKSLERTAYKDALSIFKLHVFDAWPDEAALPANEVDDEQFAKIIKRVFDLQKPRTANKLRSYLRAAYQVALGARTSPKTMGEFKRFAVQVNPIAGIPTDPDANLADKNPLSRSELQTYWTTIRNLPGVHGAALRLHLLTGSQRIAQLVRLKTSDIEAATILLFDGKGRPGKKPRPHTIPLIPAAKAAIKALDPKGEFAISTDSGMTHVAATTLSHWAVEAVADKIQGFQAKRLRSGVETLLSGAGVSLDDRGRLQSHGITGVQAKHYDGNEYNEQKLAALLTLWKLLTRSPGKTASSTRKPRVKSSTGG